MLNHCTFIGRLTRKPELRQTPGGKTVTSFSIAVDRDRPDQEGNWVSDFIDCVAWNKQAEKVCEKYNKGDLLAVSGRMQNRPVKTKDSQTRLVTELVVSTCYRVNTSKGSTAPAPTPEEAGEEHDYAILDEDDAQLPF